MKKIIHAISFLYKGERVVVKSGITGKFKVPVTSTRDGLLKTKLRNLTAQQVIQHGIIKNCDPTLYLKNDERLRVFPGGDSSYLPAHVQGIIEKHDSSYKFLPKLKKNKPPSSASSAEYPNRGDYEQSGIDMYGWWPYDDG
tara:strand:- start:127 stop:549 length:423 start_codon:yes stop_codon:yes gene_type:complete